jgi:RNA polymerase sigma-70 factor (ECF subfamily)
MSAAYDSLSLASAADVLGEPDAPSSGQRAVAAPESCPVPFQLSAAERARAFRALYDSHVAFVWRNLRRLGVSERDVEDKAQEVFVVAHRRFDDFVDRGHGPRAWLFQIVLRVASDARRHKRRHPVDPDGGAAQEREAVEPPQTAVVARREALDLLDRALGAIDLGRRAVIVLHEIEQMSAPEIARTLDIPMNTVYSRLRIARLELEQELARLAPVDADGGRSR